MGAASDVVTGGIGMGRGDGNFAALPGNFGGATGMPVIVGGISLSQDGKALLFLCLCPQFDSQLLVNLYSNTVHISRNLARGCAS